MSHTKGPWVVDTKTPGGSAWVRTVECNQPCHELALCDAGHLSVAENIANATLMASAPELLEALQIARSIIEERLSQTDDMRPIYDAIAKATGGAE